jgi:hypothetical protein
MEWAGGWVQSKNMAVGSCSMDCNVQQKFGIKYSNLSSNGSIRFLHEVPKKLLIPKNKKKVLMVFLLRYVDF